MFHHEPCRTLICICVGLYCSLEVLADGSTIGKIYHPYVEQLEWELEWRMAHENESPVTGKKRRQNHRLGLGRAFSEFWFAEAYLIAERNSEDDLDIMAYELELLGQLSEQGEYFVDYGVLFELEKEDNADLWEYSTALLLEKEFGRFSGTANLGLTYEWGDDIADEWETFLSLQGRYRYSPRLEPAVEFYSAQDTLGLGPVLTGMERVGQRQAIRWEAGIIFGLDGDTADYTLKAVLEYEF